MITERLQLEVSMAAQCGRLVLFILQFVAFLYAMPGAASGPLGREYFG